jgi:ribonuclease D
MADWIASAQQLDARLSAPFTGPVALDTEFIREKTYYPQLALVQVALGESILLLDPLALGDATAFKALLLGPALKLMHSPSEDLQTFRHHYGVLPRPLFDTQVAAALAGFGAGLGYQALIEKLLGVRLEKGETRSDWMRRPLSDSQLTYAADDVRHLAAAHAQLEAKLRELGRLGWLAEECDRQLQAAERDEGDPQPHLALRSAQRLRPEQQARLRRLLLWREQQARRSDKPRSWVLDNELSVELALGKLLQRADFEAVLDAHPRAPRRAREELWDAVTRPLTPEDRDIPLAEAPDPQWREPLRRMQESVARVAAEHALPEGLLCAKRHLEALLATREWPATLDGWRRPLLEAALMPHLPPVGKASSLSV